MASVSVIEITHFADDDPSNETCPIDMGSISRLIRGLAKDSSGWLPLFPVDPLAVEPGRVS